MQLNLLNKKSKEAMRRSGSYFWIVERLEMNTHQNSVTDLSPI